MLGRSFIGKSKNLKSPNAYVLAMSSDFKEWVIDEEMAPLCKGHWREKVFNSDGSTHRTFVDLEIGTGNGLFFAHRAKTQVDRFLIGIERKYKPLIQSVRRAVRDGSQNMRICRYNAYEVSHLFEPNEIDDVFIHFPDPWPKTRWHKNRLLQTEFLQNIFELQKNGSILEFKTDNLEYFEWALERIKASPYVIEELTFDLHKSEFQSQNFVTHFESIFLRQGLKIGRVLLRVKKGS